MRPPDCYVCHLALHDVPDDAPRQDHFTLVYFGATEDAKMAPARATAAQERSGHPYNAIWFCDEDLPLTREHENRPLDEALAAIKADPRYSAGRRRHQSGGGPIDHRASPLVGAAGLTGSPAVGRCRSATRSRTPIGASRWW